MIPFAEDLDVFFDENDFATQVTFSPDGNAEFSASGIFENPYTSNQVNQYIDIASSEPMILCRSTAQVKALKRNDGVSFDGNIYKIAELQPDDGIMKIILKKG